MDLGGHRDPGERHPCELVDGADVLGVGGLEPAEARILRGNVGRAEIRDSGTGSREPCERGLEPGAVASRQVSLNEIGRHRAFTIARGLRAINRAKPWIYSCGVAAMRAASSVRELTPSLR